MVDVSNGPVSSLPSQLFSAPVGTKCDEHPERDAVRRIQGKQIRLAVSITICARNAWMNIIGNPVKPTIRESAIGAINRRIICPHRDIEEELRAGL